MSGITLQVVIVVISFYYSHAFQSQMVITSKPSFLQLNEKSTYSLRVSEIQQLLAATSGFSVHKDLDYDGIYAPNPFDHLKSSVIITLYGGDDVVNQLQGTRFPLSADESYVPIHTLKHRLQQFYKANSLVVEVPEGVKVSDLMGDNENLEGLSDDLQTVESSITKVFRISSLSVANKDNIHLLRQSSIIHQVLSKLSSDENRSAKADLLYFEINIPQLTQPQQKNESVLLVKALIEQITVELEKLFNGQALVMVISLPATDGALLRKGRSLMAVGTLNVNSSQEDVIKELNVATSWTEDYPAIFHIVLWLMVGLIVTVIFVAYGMACIDPGLDSIIYRMTTTRLKKD